MGYPTVPASVFAWMCEQCKLHSMTTRPTWLRLVHRDRHLGVQITGWAGVLNAPDGFQVEVLPKTGRKSADAAGARRLLLEMLRCLGEFRHLEVGSAHLAAERMPLMEVFIQALLQSVETVVQRGLRSDYTSQQANLFTLRGKLLVSEQLRQNLLRPDRFYAAFDEFSANRAENRLLHAALVRVLALSTSLVHQQLTRELRFVFAHIPASIDVRSDFKRVRLDRGMAYYEPALAWARLILSEQAPVTIKGAQDAPALLFPMDALFEAYVAKHLSVQLKPHYLLQTQASGQHLVTHQDRPWLALRPDLLVWKGNLSPSQKPALVLDTKWKMLDSTETKANGSDKYGLQQGDVYQLFAYGHQYLSGDGDVVLIYPQTEVFNVPLPVFTFMKTPRMRLWVLPFCLTSQRLMLPEEPGLAGYWTEERSMQQGFNRKNIDLLPEGAMK